MKAFLLAAGLGTRLRPLTLTTPKCLIPICGKPMLFWWLRLFKQHGINEVLINLHYLGDQVKDYLDKNSMDISFTYFEEVELLGSAGTLRANRKFVTDTPDFFILYADNLTNCDLTLFYEFHLKNAQPLSMVLYRTDTPESKGIVELDKQNTIISFKEKPQKPISNLANGGIYLAKPEILDLIPDKECPDIGFDLLPKLVHHMTGWETTDYLLDIGSLDSLSRAENDWTDILKKES